MITDSIEKAYADFESRKWDKIYIALDIHGTVADSDYKKPSSRLYDIAIEPLQIISNLPEVCIILFSCCHPEHYRSYFDLFKIYDINVKYFNCNPEVANTETGCFDRKFYYNLIFEDKGGFSPNEWPLVQEAFLRCRKTNKRIKEIYV